MAKVIKEIVKEVAEFGTHFVGGEILRKILSDVGVAVGEGAAKHVKDKLPMFLSLTTEDESRWAVLWAKLNDVQQKYLTDFLEDFQDSERNHFRYVIVGMVDEEEKVVTGTGKDRKETIIKKSNALAFLKDLAIVIATHGPIEAKRRCKVGNIFNDSHITKKWLVGIGASYKSWREEDKKKSSLADAFRAGRDRRGK